MSTPEFLSSSLDLGTVRYYTELDPYYYAVDNRPLEDLAGNTNKTTVASDAARIANAIDTLSLSALMTGMFGTSDKTLGLNLTNPATGQVTLSAGVYVKQDNLNESDLRSITKMAALPYDISLAVPHPVTVGKEVYYVIEAEFTSFADGSTFPYYDGSNKYLDSSLLNAELKTNVVTGVEANIGSATVPAVTSGRVGLYQVLAKAGDTTVTITRMSEAPAHTAVVPQTWSAPTFTNSWTNTGGTNAPAGYRRVAHGVALRGNIKTGTIGQSAFLLPTPLRPLYDHVFAVSSNGAFGSLTVKSTGEVIPAVGNNTSFSLDGVVFPLT